MKVSFCTTRTQSNRAAASSAAVSSPVDFSLLRMFCRNRRTHAVLRISFQYELNLDASMRLALIVAVRTWRGPLFFSGSDSFVAKVLGGQHSSCFPGHCGPCHQMSSDCIWFPSSPLERWSAGFSRPGQCLHCVGEVRDNLRDPVGETSSNYSGHSVSNIKPRWSRSTMSPERGRSLSLRRSSSAAVLPPAPLEAPISAASPF